MKYLTIPDSVAKQKKISTYYYYNTQPKIYGPVSVSSPFQSCISVEKNPVTASIIMISLNSAVNDLRYQYCLVSVETVITVLILFFVYDVGTALLK